MVRKVGKGFEFDKISSWSEIKLEIIEKYAQAYSTIMDNQFERGFKHAYIDAFSGAGLHISKKRGEIVPGSPLNAVWVTPPFRKHFFVDLDGGKIEHLRNLLIVEDNVEIHEGDCNDLLPDVIYPKVAYEKYWRALCLLDPYGLDLSWQVIEKAGKAKSIEIFLNFPTMDINRNALWRNPTKLEDWQIERMNFFWGDDSWRSIMYRESGQLSLFGQDEIEKIDNDEVAEAFRDRLMKVAGFKFVPKPIPMRNKSKAVVYYLFFASHNKTGAKIAEDIFKKYRDRRT